LSYFPFYPILFAITFITRFRKPVNESPELNFLESTKQGIKKGRHISSGGKSSKKKIDLPESAGIVMLVYT
jgi:hypothetical protein